MHLDAHHNEEVDASILSHYAYGEEVDTSPYAYGEEHHDPYAFGEEHHDPYAYEEEDTMDHYAYDEDHDETLDEHEDAFTPIFDIAHGHIITEEGHTDDGHSHKHGHAHDHPHL